MGAVEARLRTLEEELGQQIESWHQLSKLLANERLQRRPLSELLAPIRRDETVDPDRQYAVLAMSWYAKGMYVKYRQLGRQIKAKKLYRVEEGDFVYNRLFAWKGSFAEATAEHSGCYVSNEFPTFRMLSRNA